MIRKLLVANRGEIARRVFRTCREMGIACVAVFSDPDRDAPFVGEADEAIALGGAGPSESYLRIDAVVEAARRTGADAIHPGYGFLAENPDFADAVEKAGLTWVGPPRDAIATMGSKLESKRLVTDAGVPTLPSRDLGGLDDQEAAAAAASIGYPVLVKASAGGGGKGMRIVRDPADLIEAVRGAGREAASAFGDPTVFLEQYLDAPRHIEIQVFGDAGGTIVPLFERECSIQRRHQKIIEESPSPAMSPRLRQTMSESAVTVARSVGYVGAGTVEFLVQDDSFYFLEMNTRLQVEHPVTEEVTGIDLVRLQILVASGESLSEDVTGAEILGHAIEARLYAEDPRNGFLPATGTLSSIRFPELPGLRIDSGVAEGSVIGVDYDPMLAKVVAWAETREEAAALLAAGLQRARIHGTVTNRDLLVRILRHPEFLDGATDTHFLERNDPAVMGRPLPGVEERALAAVAAALTAQALRRAGTPVLASIPSGWRNNPSGLQSVTFESGSGKIRVGYRFESRGGVTVDVDGTPLADVDVVGLSADRIGISTAGHLRWFDVARGVAPDGHTLHHVDGPSGYLRLVERRRFPVAGREEEPGSLHALMPGKVVAVRVSEGDTVAEGATLVVMEAMKMEHTVRSPFAGTVVSLRVGEGDQVSAEEVLVVVEES